MIYEDDVVPLWEGHIEIKDRVREELYPLLYGKQYKFSTTGATKGARRSTEPPDYDGLPPADADPTKMPVKPYIPPTAPEDLMRVLDAPMN